MLAKFIDRQYRKPEKSYKRIHVSEAIIFAALTSLKLMIVFAISYYVQQSDETKVAVAVPEVLSTVPLSNPVHIPVKGTLNTGSQFASDLDMLILRTQEIQSELMRLKNNCNVGTKE
ncbi:MAG: hypothetical protein AAF497_10265 [Planctomycetota bacterium]